MLEESPDLDIVITPVGGGGLASGVAAYIKFLCPETKIIAVEPEDAACLKEALIKRKPTRLKSVGIFADGVAVAQIGHYPFSILKDLVDEHITVDTDEICAAIKDIFDETRSISEPAGAVATAGLKKYIAKHIRGVWTGSRD